MGDYAPANYPPVVVLDKDRSLEVGFEKVLLVVWVFMSTSCVCPTHLHASTFSPASRG